MHRIVEFIKTWRQYSGHGPVYATRIAFGVVFRGLPF